MAVNIHRNCYTAVVLKRLVCLEYYSYKHIINHCINNKKKLLGWCCCCFRCKFCFPKERIEDAKTFFVNFPPGVYVDENNEVINFEPTFYEKNAYKRLEQLIMKI